MSEMALSHDVIRVVPFEHEILPGYLFAFLSSSLALSMIRQSAYGSVIQHIEPHHIFDLPIPIPSDESFQRRIHNLIIRASSNRTEATKLLDKASGHFDRDAGRFRFSHEHALAIGVLSRTRLARRIDAFHHVGWSTEAASKGDPLGDIADVQIPGRMKLVLADRGIPFVSGVDLYQVRPSATKRLARWLPGLQELVLRKGDILLQVDGQRYGLLGRPAYAGMRVEGHAASWHLARISTVEVARVFAFARSESGRRAIVRTSYGTSVPAISERWLRTVQIPPLPENLTRLAEQAIELREEAETFEDQAIKEIESWLA
jgi:type I restriction enzyme S subunit